MLIAFYMYVLSLFNGVAEIPQPIKFGNSLVNIPNDQTKKEFPLVIFFGGAAWATPQNLWDNTPEEYFKKAVLVYSPCYTYGGGNLKKLEKEVIAFLAKKNIKISTKSACGFSGGGPDAMIAEEPSKYKALAFIDPTPVANGVIKYSANMILSYSKNNWMFSDFYGKVVNFRDFEALSAKIKKAGGTAEETNIKHDVYFKYFLEKFIKQLI